MPLSLSPKLRALLQGALLFVPFVGYAAGDWLVAHWALAKAIDHALAPYAFNASLLLGLLAGLAQMGWNYARRREISSYLVQQMVLLLLFTLVPLRFGHYVHGYSIFGILQLIVGLGYGLDAFLGARLFLAYPLHFSPEKAEMFERPAVRRIMQHMGLAFSATMGAQGAFVLLGNHLLTKSLYLLLLPFVSKGLWGAFAAFCFGYGRMAKKRGEARQAAEGLAAASNNPVSVGSVMAMEP